MRGRGPSSCYPIGCSENCCWTCCEGGGPNSAVGCRLGRAIRCNDLTLLQVGAPCQGMATARQQVSNRPRGHTAAPVPGARMGKRWGGTVRVRRCGRGAPGTVKRFVRDRDWKDWTRAPRCGDPRWEPRMVELVALAKVGTTAVPLPRGGGVGMFLLVSAHPQPGGGDAGELAWPESRP